MDDLKLYANSTDQMQQLLEITKTFSQDICMSFGTDKFKAVQLWRGKLINTEGFHISEEEITNDLTENQSYKYLGFHQLRGIKHTEIQEKLTTMSEKRLRIICKSYLNTANKIKAINTYAIPILTYSFGIISWSNTDLESLERLVRKTLSNHCKRHPKSAVGRITIPQHLGGLGIINIKQLHNNQIEKLSDYFKSRSEIPIFNAVSTIDKNYTPLKLSCTEHRLDTLTTEYYVQTWKQKELHGDASISAATTTCMHTVIKFMAKIRTTIRRNYGFYNDYTR
jgi:hypothetical protein